MSEPADAELRESGIEQEDIEALRACEEMEKRAADYGKGPTRNPFDGVMVKLKSADGEIVEMSFLAVQMSTILRNMHQEFPDKTIPLQLVNVTTLRRVAEYCEKHESDPAKEIEKPLRSDDFTQCGISEWDVKFVDISNQELQELILAANYLDVKALLELCAAKIASLMKGKTVEELREQFGIENDFTPEEEALIRQENKWIDDA